MLKVREESVNPPGDLISPTVDGEVKTLRCCGTSTSLNCSGLFFKDESEVLPKCNEGAIMKNEKRY